MRSHWLLAPAVVASLVLSACGSSEPSPDLLQLKAETVLPPGQSGLFTAAGQAAGSASGEPGDYGEHVDDQRLLYWQFGYKDGAFDQRGTLLAPAPKAGVEVYLDPFGVPSV